MTFKLFGSNKNQETQRAIELAKIQFPEMEFYDIEANPENLKEYINSCFGNKDGSPSIAQYEYNEPYVTIHRIASDQTIRGIFHVAMEECKKYANNIRIDTHKDNVVMQWALEKYDFQHCGVIYLANGEPREAFQWVNSK